VINSTELRSVGFDLAPIGFLPAGVTFMLLINEHSEQARAPHTNGPREVPRCGALSQVKSS
jgi:hypothetical protein